jgi:hypothetical protein
MVSHVINLDVKYRRLDVLRAGLEAETTFYCIMSYCFYVSTITVLFFRRMSFIMRLSLRIWKKKEIGVDRMFTLNTFVWQFSTSWEMCLELKNVWTFVSGTSVLHRTMIMMMMIIITIIIQFNSILYFNVLIQQLQEPITESAQEDKYIHSTEINIKMRTKLN